MSFLLPFRNGDRMPKTKRDVEAQVAEFHTIETPTKNKSQHNSVQEEKKYDDATALQALNEASFIVPDARPPLNQSSTLIPYPFAKLVTTTTGLGTFAVRTYARAFEWGLGLGKETTLRSLELTRAGIEGVLKVSAKDVTSRSGNNSELARADTENVLARSISTLHWAFSGATFATSAGFSITGTYLQGVEIAAVQGLGTLNAILGDTESSRAVSAIITLIKEELTRPGAEDGLVPGYWDLIVACAGFVVLQRWGRRKTVLEFRGNGGEETIWDLVIDDRGFRADVVGTKRDGGNEVTATKTLTNARNSTYAEDDGLSLERGMDLNIPPTVMLSAQDQANLSDEEIRDRILAQLPPDTRAVITSNTLTVKTVQVDIHGSETAHIEAPPGLTMVSEHLGRNDQDSELPNQTIVFRTSLKRNSSSEITPVDRLRMTSTEQDALENGDMEEAGLVMTAPKRRRSISRRNLDARMDYLDIDSPSPKTLSEADGPVANQKKTRRPVAPVSFAGEDEDSKSISSRPNRDQHALKVEKVGIIKKALQTLTPHHSDSHVNTKSTSSTNKEGKPILPSLAPLSRITDNDTVPIKRIYPMPESIDETLYGNHGRSPSVHRNNSTSYFTVHEKKRESTVSQTDSFSVHSTESTPGSPTSMRTYARADSGLSKTKSHIEMSMQPNMRTDLHDGTSSRHHYRSKSFVPSLYSMGTKHSDEAIILQPKTPIHRSMFEDHTMLTALANDGKVPGMFPDRHLVKSIRRFARFASASYGSNFLRVMGITKSESASNASNALMDQIVEEIHHEHSSFATHTGLPADTILLSSFCDPKGGPVNATKNQPTMMPLMHFVSIDHDSKAVVLTCRGTWGFEDVLTDMTCDYDDFHWQGGMYHVHQGIHASARRLLEGGGRRVMSTIQASLEEFPDYGLVLCGHSLGGAVAAVLALLISEPNKNRQTSYFDSEPETMPGSSFVTATQQKLITGGPSTSSAPPVNLPAGRPIHVFAYGPPASFSPALRLATRGLITTIINHNDIVPSLSLGTLQDYKAVAIHLKQDPSSPLVKVRSAMIEKLKHAMLGNFWHRASASPAPAASSDIPTVDSEDGWQWTALTTIRNLMISDKLLPPGEVFIVETSRVYDRLDSDPESSSVPGTTPGDSAYRPLGRAATRVQFKLIRNVESRFREVKFGSGMFADHSPGRYEGGLGALEQGIFEDI